MKRPAVQDVQIILNLPQADGVRAVFVGGEVELHVASQPVNFCLRMPQEVAAQLLDDLRGTK